METQPSLLNTRKHSELDTLPEEESLPKTSLQDVIADMQLELWYIIFQQLWRESTDASLKQHHQPSHLPLN